MAYLSVQVQSQCGETSDKFIPEPTKDQITEDLLLGLKRFKNAARWKEFWRNQKIRQLEQENQQCDQNDSKLESTSKMKVTHAGLGTGLKPENAEKVAPKGSDNLEKFLRRLETTLIEQLLKSNPPIPSEKAIGFRELFNDLRNEEDQVVVPTDKTNNYTVMSTQKYIDWVSKHLTDAAEQVPRTEVVEIHEEAVEFADSISNFISSDEFNFIQESLTSKAIPQPQLLVKDHKPKNGSGNFPTRLVIPATNFTAAFSKLGYLGIKKVLDEHNVNYNKHTIIQASDLKEKLEKLTLNKKNARIISLDIENMYPSI